MNDSQPIVDEPTYEKSKITITIVAFTAEHGGLEIESVDGVPDGYEVKLIDTCELYADT